MQNVSSSIYIRGKLHSWFGIVLSCVQAFKASLSLFPPSILANQGCCITEHSGSTSLHAVIVAGASRSSWSSLNCPTGCSTSSQQHRAYTCSLTINSAGFRRWKGSVRDGELMRHCAGMSIVWQGGLFISGTPLWLICTEHPPHLFTAQLPFVLLSVAHPALERWSTESHPFE